MDVSKDYVEVPEPMLGHVIEKIVTLAHFIRLSHTIFSLPFALTALAVASALTHPVSWDIVLGIIFGLACLRASAMTFNRIVDHNIDALNPRTQNRELVTGKITLNEARIFLALTTLGYFLASLYIELPLAFIVIFLLVTWSYSLTKRFTWFSHFWLGTALAGAPIGVWLVVTKQLDLTIFPLALAVVFWVAGFDILYSLQDWEFDRQFGLHSIPAQFGVKKALFFSRMSHVLSVIALALFGFLAHLNWVYYLGTTFFALGMIHEQLLVKPDDFSKINHAFFTVNGMLSVMFFLFTLFSVIL